MEAKTVELEELVVLGQQRVEVVEAEAQELQSVAQVA